MRRARGRWKLPFSATRSWSGCCKYWACRPSDSGRGYFTSPVTNDYQIRSPKSEVRKKPEARNPKPARVGLDLVRISVFFSGPSPVTRHLLMILEVVKYGHPALRQRGDLMWRPTHVRPAAHGWDAT